MDFFYDGQIRRYVTQFMRIFIGFKYRTGDGELRSIPVMYGDLTRQVASIIKDNSENKMPSVPRIACYITGLDLDKTRLSDATFVSKVNVRERNYQMVDGAPVYGNSEGGSYTVERLMPTPFKMTVRADIWSSNTDQKLQILEQILVLFNPSLEIQTTDNYLDWTSLSVIELSGQTFSSRSIPQGAESDIDICTLDFEMPIWITPPAKVKKLGIVRAVIANMFTDTGDAADIANLVYNGSPDVTQSVQIRRYGIVILKSQNGNDYDYEVYPVNVGQAILDAGLDLPPERIGKKLDWSQVLELYGGYQNGVSQMYLQQPNGNEIVGTIAVNPADTTTLVLTVDPDTLQSNTILTSSYDPSGRGTIDAIINPYSFSPLTQYGSSSNYPDGLRYLMLDDVNTGDNVGVAGYSGPTAWKNADNSDPIITANSIIEWNGSEWVSIFDPETASANTYVTNLRTGIQYKWDGVQWLKSFEGEYLAGSWRLVLNP
jgi:hypothetical protein